MANYFKPFNRLIQLLASWTVLKVLNYQSSITSISFCIYNNYNNSYNNDNYMPTVHIVRIIISWNCRMHISLLKILEWMNSCTTNKALLQKYFLNSIDAISVRLKLHFSNLEKGKRNVVKQKGCILLTPHSRIQGVRSNICVYYSKFKSVMDRTIYKCYLLRAKCKHRS